MASILSAVQPVAIGERTPLWLWPNLLSLDAPIIALLWQALFARSFRATLDPLAPVLLVLSVWIIYVADRVFDAWRDPEGEPRHEFYRRNWRAIVPVWITAFGVAAWLAWSRLSVVLFERGVVLLFAVVIYFAVVHFMGRRWPKELAVAVLFAAGTTLASWHEARSWIDLTTFVLFALLCWINCAAIEKWEMRGSNDWPVRGVAIVAALIALIVLYDHRPIVAGAETASAFAFVILDRARLKLSSNVLRVLADVALVTPALFLPIVRLRP